MVIETRAEFPMPPMARPAHGSGENTIAAVWLVRNILENWRAGLAIAIGVFGCALAYVLLDAPTYTADALLRVQAPRDSGLGQLATLTRALDVRDPNVLGEIEVLKSRATVGSAIAAVNGHVKVTVLHSFPLVGTAMQGWLPQGADGLGTPLLGMSWFAWGGEHLGLRTVDVPDAWLGQDMTLIAGEAGAWTLLDPDGDRVASGKVGQTFADPQAHVRLQVTSLLARPGTKFGITRFDLLDRFQEVSQNLTVNESTPQSSTIAVSYKDRDPVFAAALVNAVTTAYLRMDGARRTEEARRSLSFLNGQLPRLRRQLDESAAAFNAFRLKVGTVDIDGQIKDMLDQGQALDKLRVELELRRDDLAGRYSDQHPVIEAVNRKLAFVRGELDRLGLQMSSMPQTQQTYLRLAGDVQVNTQLYASLLDSEQQTRLAQAGMVGNAAIIDSAVKVDIPTWPKPAVVLVGGALLALGSAFAACQLIAVNARRLRDADSLECASGVEVLTVIPHARVQAKMDSRRLHGHRLIVQEDSQSSTSDALRALRMALQMRVLRGVTARVLLVTAPVGAQGSTFIACNVARLLAAAGESVLLIDADLARGAAPGYLGIVSPGLGLTQVMRGEAPLTQAVLGVDTRLSLLPAGAASSDSGDVMQAGKFQKLIDHLKPQYAWIIVDAPPIAVRGDVAVLARVCNNVLLVARHEKTSLMEISHAVRELQKFGAYLVGAVFNDYVRKAFTSNTGYSQSYDESSHREWRVSSMGGMDRGGSEFGGRTL
ncbi:MAG: lipopolysaccharide biosynthesis protein [Gammaproteobacteria bacterium]|nr:lipopolysaccharide biosynthesis protein [Gammaproteobacteria bacterium]